MLFAVFLITVTAWAPIGNAQTAAPVGAVGVGDSPFALEVSTDGSQAVVVNLFPEGPSSSNVKVVDLNAQLVATQLRVGTRLVAVAVTGTRALVVNEDQDFVFVIDISNGQTLAQVGVGSRPSNIIVAQPNLAVATNGTSGDLSFIDLQRNTLLGPPLQVGSDPRAVAVNPVAPYAYVALGGEDAVAVVDLGTTPFTRLGTVPVGRSPVAIAVTPGGGQALVCNLSNNTVSLLDLTDPRAPRVMPTSMGFFQTPVGVQPTALTIAPDGKTAYIANLGSNWFTALDLEKREVEGVVFVERADPANPDSKVSSPTSGIRITPDGTRLLVTEFRNDARLLMYDVRDMPLEPLPEVEVPGEPQSSSFLDVDPSLPCPGFYIAEVQLAEGAEEGFWGMEVLTTAGERLLQGGFNLGGGFDANAGNPGFGAFNIANANNEHQRVSISLEAQALPTEGFNEANLGLSVRILDRDKNPLGPDVSGSPPLQLEMDLSPGFYTVEIQSLPGSPRGTFQMGLGTQFLDRIGGAFQGGVVVGGYLARDSGGGSLTGFGSFCISEQQQINIGTFNRSTYGEAGAGDLVLTIRDRDRNVVRTISNSVPGSTVVSKPGPPDLMGLQPSLYVDASAAPGGNGSSASPFRSITRATQSAPPGAVILVRPGEYSPLLTGESLPLCLNCPPNLKLIGSGSETTIIDTEGGIRENAVLLVADGIRFAGFTVRNSLQTAVFINGARNIQVDSNFFTSNTRFGLGAFQAPGLVVTGNVAVANQESGIVVSATVEAPAPPGTPAGCPSSFGACVIDNIANDNRADGILGSQGGNLHILSNQTLNNGSSGIELNNRNDPSSVPMPLVGYVEDNLVNNNGGLQFAFAGTGILVTEGARAERITNNQLVNNRPYGIGIFLRGQATLIANNKLFNTQLNALLVQRDSRVTEISDNTITNSGLSGLFVENNAQVTRILRNLSTDNSACNACPFSKAGLSVLDRSSVGTVEGNFFDRNAVGMEVAGDSRIDSLANSTFENNNDAGIFVRENSTLATFNNNRVRSNRGQGGLLISSSTGEISNSEISGNRATGISFFQSSTFTLNGNMIINNEGEGGIFLSGGSQVTLTGNTISQNTKTGVLAVDGGTLGTLSGNNVTNNNGLGLNASGGATLQCSGGNTISGNSGGNFFGATSGCQ